MEKLESQELESLVKKLVHEELRKELPHTCFTCSFFRFKNGPNGEEQEGKGNRGCRYPNNLEVVGGVCQMWDLQTDPRKRKPSFVSYYPKR